MAQTPEGNRDETRSRLFASRKLKTKLIKIRDVDVEIHQPTIGDVLNMRDNQNQTESLMHLLINYCYVPGTEQRVFEPTDREAIMSWGVDDWFGQVAQAVTDLTGVNVGEAEKN